MDRRRKGEKDEIYVSKKEKGQGDCRRRVLDERTQEEGEGKEEKIYEVKEENGVGWIERGRGERMRFMY